MDAAADVVVAGGARALLAQEKKPKTMAGLWISPELGHRAVVL
jgi:hypothetical protein